MIIIGFDWARDKHDVCIQNAEGVILQERTVRHDAQALRRLSDQIAEIEPDCDAVYAAVEQHDGALLAWLLACGYVVYAINPKSADRARDVFRPAGAKDDPGDARVAADLLRSNLTRFKPLLSQSEETLHLRSLSRLRMRMVQQKTAQMQRLRTLLAEWSPQLSKLCGDFNRKWQKDLVCRWPLHEDLVSAHGNSINALLKAHRLSVKTREKIAAVGRAEPLPIPEGRKDAVRFEILMLIEQIEFYLQRLQHLDRELTEAFLCHPAFKTFNSLPVKGVPTLAAITASFGDRRSEPTGWRQFAARWGVAPVTRASGRTRSVYRRRACDTFALQAFTDFAFTSSFSIRDCWSLEFYQRKRSEGHDHHEALRAVALRWVKIMWKMWHDGTTYDEEYHRNRKAQAR